MQAITGSSILKQKRTGRPIVSWLTWNRLLPGAIFAIVTGFVTVSAISGGHWPRSKAQKTETAAESMNSIVGVDKVNDQSTLVSQVPSNGTLQIQIQHRFTEGRASVWLDNLHPSIARRDQESRACVPKSGRSPIRNDRSSHG